MRVAVAELTGNFTYVLVRIGQQIFGQLHFLLQNVLFQRNTRDGCKQMGQVLLVVAEVRGDLGDLDVLVAAPFSPRTTLSTNPWRGAKEIRLPLALRGAGRSPTVSATRLVRSIRLWRR